MLTLTARPRTINNAGQVSTITATAVMADMTAGSGTVRLSSAAGSLKTPVELTLADGEASADFTCDAAVDPACSGQIRISAEWVVNGKLVEATTAVIIAAPDSGAGGGTGGGAGGGTGGGTGGGGDDAGAGGGMGGGTGGGTGDGGQGTLTLTPARSTIFRGVGDSTTISAVLTVGGAPGANEPVDLTTSLGELSLPDAGAGGMAISGTADGTGRLQVRLTETGVAGVATITATALDGGVTGMTTVRILEVNSIAHTATVCGTTMNCTIMGIRNSGFNETALVRFTVRDSNMMPLAGVPVTFVANGPPSGLTITPMAVSNSMGIAETSVQSGLSVGSFTVTASVGTVSATSPTIGVRGAKPSNFGFTLQCQKTNLAAWIDPAPPLALTNACEVTLVDRLGNPVGRVTSVNLNSEAGAVPANIMTIGFMPSGSNPNEGKGTFTFNTVGRWPPEDVTPVGADPTQYPIPRLAEPSYMAGALTRNPRDGLVTILAYTDGEEHYFDDNSNGVRDPSERFIDQGEPFIDANDNNQWDAGEQYTDVDGNGAWTPPNGTWDANTKVWTVAHVLYTNYASGAVALFSPSSFNVPKGSQTIVDVYMPDFNLNHVESGSSVGTTRVATKGSVAFINSNLGLDGWGFEFEARRLVNATGTGPCDATQPICVYRTLFGSWGRGYIGQLRLTGAATSDMTPPQGDTITVTTTTRGVAGSAPVSGTFQ
ncbi:MAG: Ig-like domain-containing protein [Myxococcota bacterium]